MKSLLEYSKLQKLLLVIIISLALLSCGDNNKVTITKEEYSKLTGDTTKNQYPKYFEIDYTGLSVLKQQSGIVPGSDNHEYLVTNYGRYDMNVEHYIECVKCKKLKQEEKINTYSGGFQHLNDETYLRLNDQRDILIRKLYNQKKELKINQDILTKLEKSKKIRYENDSTIILTQ